MLFVDAATVASVLPMLDAIDALSIAFAGTALPEIPPRSVLAAGGGEFVVMPVVGSGSVGAKLLTINPSNLARGEPLIQGVFVLFGSDSLRPQAMIDGAALTGIRTAAVSGVATRLLARADARRLVIFGAGVQARAHLVAMLAVRSIETLTVVEPDAERGRALVAFARAEGLDARLGAADSVRDADIVCTCTTSPEPVFDGRLLATGAHVNAMGSYRPETREVDDALVTRAWIVLETRADVLAEAGDLLIPLGAGVISDEHIAVELADVATGRARPPQPGDVTLFKSVGVAFEDLVIAQAMLARLDGDRRVDLG